MCKIPAGRVDGTGANRLDLVEGTGTPERTVSMRTTCLASSTASILTAVSKNAMHIQGFANPIDATCAMLLLQQCLILRMLLRPSRIKHQLLSIDALIILALRANNIAMLNARCQMKSSPFTSPPVFTSSVPWSVKRIQHPATMRISNGWLWHVTILHACTTAYAAFSFQWTEPAQCGTMNVTWSGGSPPYSLFIVPEHAAMITHQVSSDNWDAAIFSFQLPLPQGKRMVMTMSDSRGFASSGVSEIVVVGASNGTTCDDVDAPAFNFATPVNLQQCSPFIVNQYVGSIYPVVLHAFVPGGSSLALQSTGDAINWKADVAAGTTMIFSVTDMRGRAGGTTEFLTVANSNDTSCFDAYSPTSLASFPSTTASPSPSSSSSSSSSALPSSVSPSTSTQSASPSSAPAASSSSSVSRNTLAAIVVGAVVGGLVVLAAVLSLLWFRRRASRNGEVVDLADDPPMPTPGIYEPAPSPPRGSASYKHMSAASTPGTPLGPSELNAAGSSQPSVANAAGGPLTRELSATSVSMPTAYIVRTDAEDARRNVVELPPQYDERRTSVLLDVRNGARVGSRSQSPSATPSEKDVLVSSFPIDPSS